MNASFVDFNTYESAPVRSPRCVPMRALARGAVLVFIGLMLGTLFGLIRQRPIVIAPSLPA